MLKSQFCFCYISYQLIGIHVFVIVISVFISLFLQMMWATDFDEVLARGYEENCLEALILELPKDSNIETNANSIINSKMDIKDSPTDNGNSDFITCDKDEVKSDSKYPFCGLTKANFWTKQQQQQMQICSLSVSTRSIDDEISVFCVAAILITNRQKIMRETTSIDDVIKVVLQKN